MTEKNLNEVKKMPKKNEKNVPVIETDSDEYQTIGSVEGKSEYGHRLNTQAALMDTMIASGKFTHAQIEASMVKNSPCHPNEARARQALKQHIDYLGKGKNPGVNKVIIKANTGIKNAALKGVITAFKAVEKTATK